LFRKRKNSRKIVNLEKEQEAEKSVHFKFTII